jgi:hypothetical protein
VETGTKMVMDKNVASSAIAKQKRSSRSSDVPAQQLQQQLQKQLLQQQQSQVSREKASSDPAKNPDPPIIVQDSGNPNQVELSNL